MTHDRNAALAGVLDYHRRSKHGPRAYAPGPGHLDWATQPDPFRTFGGAPVVDLPLLADGLGTSFGAARRGELPPPSPLRLESVATLLELSLGLSAWKSQAGSRWALRCNPSSGNLHPTEGYVVCAAMPGLAAGVHHYVSRDHRLEHRCAPEAMAWGRTFPEGGIVVGLSSIHWREAWKYGMRAWRYCQHDCGHALAALCYAAAALGWRARRLDRWGDGDIAGLLGLARAGDFEGAETESPDALLWVGPDGAEPDPDALLPVVAAGRWLGRANRLSPQQRKWDDIPRVAAAAVKPRTAGSDTWIPADLPPLAEAPADMPAATLFRRRRSAVAFDGVTGCPARVFFGMLDALLPRAGAPPWGAAPGRPRVHPVLFVHRVDGLDPGLYCLARDPEALPRLKSAMRAEWLWDKCGPSHLPLYCLMREDLAPVAGFVSCRQDIAADSCFSLGFLAGFRSVVEDAPWQYRRLYWETGVLGQVLYLEAEAAGLRGTGIGCYFDDEMHRLLGLADDSFQSLYHFTVGGPLEDARLRTEPPYAHLGRGS